MDTTTTAARNAAYFEEAANLLSAIAHRVADGEPLELTGADIMALFTGAGACRSEAKTWRNINALSAEVTA